MCLNVFRQGVNGVCCIQKDDSISCLALRLGANGGWGGGGVGSSGSVQCYSLRSPTPMWR